MVKTSPSSERERYASSIPGQGAKTPHASMPKQTKNIKQKKYCNKFNKGFKNGPLKKKKNSRPSLETVCWNLGGTLSKRIDLKERGPEPVWKKENVKE